MKRYLFSIICAAFFKLALSSSGDLSKFYTNCFYECKLDICEKEADSSLNINYNFNLWSCFEDCDYRCQWETVDGFIARKWPIPQFHGKWPFLRFFGLQEPASCLFSLLNFAVIIVQLRKLKQQLVSDSPYYVLWHFYSMVCLNAWIWSAVYHARDSDLTERLDYMSASAMVFVSFFAMTIRVFQLGTTIYSALWTFTCLVVLINHLSYLWFFKFDYSYNMTFNIVAGSLTVVGWILWAALSPHHPSRKTVVTYCLLMCTATALELFDFPPLLWILDAHALWHLATAFIVILFYRFLRSDSRYLGRFVILPTQEKTD